MYLSKLANCLVDRTYVEAAYIFGSLCDKYTFEEWLASPDCGYVQLTEEEEAAFRKKNQYKRQNEHIKHRYDRFSFVLPKGYKGLIEKQAQEEGITVTDFIKQAVISKMKICTK